MEEKEKCTPDNCPYAVDPSGIGRAWGMSPEGWEQVKIRHQEHCSHGRVCQHCGKVL